MTAATDMALVRIDDAMKEFRRRPIQRRLIDAARTISPDTVVDIASHHTALCQTYLPASRPAVRCWDRRNGTVTVRLEAGSAYSAIQGEFVPLDLPYGAKARLALIAITTEAVRTGSPIVTLGRSMTHGLEKILDRSPDGDDIRQFRRQLAALVVMTIRLGWTRENQPIQIVTPIADLVAGLDPAAWASPLQRRGHWQCPEIRLAKPFFEALDRSTVPLDVRALATLAHTPLGLDAYCWLAQRLHRIPIGESVFVPWARLHEQFGGFARLRAFRRHFWSVLTSIHDVYQDARIEDEYSPDGQPAGLRLYHSAPPVPPRSVTVDNR
ncbi:replication protein RepA [Telmatospirillum sp.]|uniref:replication protein RepA n=1 Tax=Telmatospirillum sp. TaxID=2079197 RepID=UPI00284D1295|nr:replication protein RepA [Telmatospirillum sp.]MDR3441335.1 replication protein RepA [Telmatospirillum sp.]